MAKDGSMGSNPIEAYRRQQKKRDQKKQKDDQQKHKIDEIERKSKNLPQLFKELELLHTFGICVP